MKAMKKVLAVTLALMMILSMGVMGTVSAEETENQVIYFEIPTGEGLLDWEGAKIFCHIWEYGGADFAQWQSKKEACVKTDTEGVWMYDITAKGFTVEEVKTYAIIFSEGNNQTYDTLFDISCMGDILYCKGEESIIENPSDSSKQAIAAYWKNADPTVYGPVRQLTSLGNVVGECFAPGADAESLYTDFIVSKLEVTLGSVDMTQEELLAHASSQLGISAERAYELELEAGLHSPLTNDELPLPSDPSSDDEEVETNRYYFYYPEIWESTDDEKTAGIYWWDATNAPTAWPGYEANKADAEGVYYYDVPKDVTSIIWNNFEVDSVDAETGERISYQTKNISSEYYEAGDSDTYPNGLDSFDGMIFVVDQRNSSFAEMNVNQSYEGEWYYYYGNGEYGVTSAKGDRVYTDSYLDEPLAPATEDEYALGDVNMDGKFNIKDATTIQKYIAKMVEFEEVQQVLADYNGDQKINIKDATMIQKKLAKLI